MRWEAKKSESHIYRLIVGDLIKGMCRDKRQLKPSPLGTRDSKKSRTPH